MNVSGVSQSFDELEGLLRLTVEQITSAPPPVEVAERVLGRAAKWEEAAVRTVAKTKSQAEDPHPGPLPKGEGVRRRLYLAAGMALALVVLVAVAIAIVSGLPREKTIAVPLQVKKTEPENNSEPKNKTEPKENPPNAAYGLGGVTPPPAGTSNDMRLGMQPGGGFGGSGSFGASGAVPKRGGASAAKEEQAGKTDQERILGNWSIVNDDSKRKGEMWVIYEDRILMYANFSGITAVWHFHHLNAGQDPKQIDITVTKVNGSPSSPIGIIKGIYVLDGDELRLCLAEMGKDRPATFPEKPGPDEVLILHRGKLGASPPKAKEEVAPAKEEQPGKERPAAEKPAAEKPAEKAVTIRGKVVDDATGKPIAALVVQAGKLYPANPKRVIWGYKEDRFSTADGSFSTTIRWDEGWNARVMADGYFPQPVLTAAPPAGKDEMEVTVRLVRIPDKVRGVVLDHTGKPLKDAAVYAGGASLTLAAGEAWLQVPEGLKDDRAQPVHTDEQGRFELPTGGAISLGISHARFDAWPAAIPPSGEITIRLPEPARVEVNLDIDGADKEGVIFYQLLSHLMPEFAVGDRGGSVGCLTSSRYMKIANPGKLVLPALPPGKYQLARQGGVMLDRQIFEVKAGETKTFDFVRGKGARVRGKVTWPADARLMSIVVSVLSEKNDVLASTSPGGDGSFLTERIPPGKHQLIAYAFAEQTPERLRNTSPIIPSYEAQTIRIDVPADGEVKGADLVLKPIPGREPKTEPVKEKPAAEKPAAKPAEGAAAPQKNPLLGDKAAEHVKKFPPSFSKAVNGVEVGIAVACDRKAFHEGERVPLELVIRNVSQKTLVIQHSLYPPETPPTVTGADGKQLSIEEILLLGANRRYKDTLKPNEVAVYRHLGLGLGEKPNPPGTFWHPFLKSADAAAGKYRLIQQLHLTIREEGQDTGTSFLAASGEVQFEIESADPKKGSEKPAEKPVEKPAEKPAENPVGIPTKPAVTTVTVQGKVVDDATGKKLDRFFTQGGKFDPADPTKVTWGTWELRTRGPSDWFQTEIRWGEGMTARIVADGYLPEPVLTAAPEGDKKIIEKTVRLKRGRKVRGVVLDHTGKPLKDAAVFPIGQGVVTMAAGEVLTPGGAKPARTDEQGSFELQAGEAKSLAVSHKQLDAWPAVIPESGELTVRLPEPARIEINLDIDGADKESNIYYELIVSQMPEFRALVQGGVLRLDRYAKIANPGKLVLAGLPPGKYQLSRRPGRMLENQMFEIKSGEVKTIDYIRKTGARVRGKLTWPADAKLYDITVTVTGGPFQKCPWSDHQWATVYAALTPAEDGTFLTERIPPGTYELAAYAYEPVTKGQPFLSGFGGFSGPTFYAAVTIEVPAEGEVKLDDLALKSSRPGK